MGCNRPRTVLSGVVVLCATVASSGVAFAGGPTDPTPGDQVLGTKGGVRYVSETLAVGSSGHFSAPYDGADVSCGGYSSPWHPTSGGASLSGSAAQNFLAEMRAMDLSDSFEQPPNAEPDDWWQSVVKSVIGRSLTGFAVCSKRTDLAYQSEEVADSPSGERSASLSCPPGLTVAGGSAFIATSDSFINSSYPTGTDGWAIRIYDTGNGVGGMNIGVVCRLPGGVQINKRGRPGIAAGTPGALRVGCGRRRHVVGGGAKLSGPIAEAHLAESFPFDGADADGVPDDGWNAIAANDAGADKKLKVFAICVRRG